MASGLDEVYTCVDAVVNHLVAVDTVLLLKVGVETGFDIVEDWLPASCR